MALRINIELANGITLSEGYLRIRSTLRERPVRGGETVQIIYDVFRDAEARADLKPSVISKSVLISSDQLDGGFRLSDPGFKNLVRSGYLHLKALSEFAGAQDC